MKLRETSTVARIIRPVKIAFLLESNPDPRRNRKAKTAITHGTAFTATEFATMAQKGMKLTWSPAR